MTDMPSYKKPPVVEVAIGVQFAPLAGFMVPHVGLLWDGLREDFPVLEERAPIQHVIEPPAGSPASGGASMVFQIQPDMPRTWFVNGDGDKIIQIQKDRFLFNWRRNSFDDADYPRYPAVKEDFLKYWHSFCEFLQKQDLQPPAVDQCELTYVNQISQGETPDSSFGLREMFTPCQWQTRGDFLREPEHFQWSAKFALPDGVGRLHVDAAPSRFGKDPTPTIRFSLTARGRPKDNIDAASISEWYDLAREWIVCGFADLVHEETDALWEKEA